MSPWTWWPSSWARTDSIWSGENSASKVSNRMIRRVRPRPTTAALAVRLFLDWSATKTPTAATPARRASARSRSRRLPSASGVSR